MLVVMLMQGMWGCHRKHIRVLLQECHDLGEALAFRGAPGPSVTYIVSTILSRIGLPARLLKSREEQRLPGGKGRQLPLLRGSRKDLFSRVAGTGVSRVVMAVCGRCCFSLR